MRASLIGLLTMTMLAVGGGCQSSRNDVDGGAGGASAVGGVTGSGGATGVGGRGGATGVGGGGGATGGHGGGSDGGHGGGSDGGAGAGGASGDAGVNCSPACTTGSVCVGTGIVGGVVITVTDAGVCPAGTHPSSVSPFCERDLTYACMTLPTACGGSVSCTCASTLCPNLHICQVRGDGVLTCIQQVP